MRWILWSRDGVTGPAEPVRAERPTLAQHRARADAGTADRSPRRPAPANPAARQHTTTPHHLQGAPSPEPATTDPDDVNEIIDSRRVDVVFQAIVDVERDQVVGFEALTRGPEGPLSNPADLFAAARAIGRAGELDWICRALAFRKFLDAKLPGSMSLFVNVEPDSLIAPCPEELLETVWEAEAQLRVFVDLPGRALSRHPREVLETVRNARAARWGISLDDTEFSSAGLSLLPVIEPDVIRLHHSVLTSGAAGTAAAISAAISATAQTGASLLLEKVEDPEASALGRSIGATFQQGHLFAREHPLPATAPSPLRPVRLLEHPDDGIDSPFAIVTESSANVERVMQADGVDLISLSLIRHAATINPVPVIAAVLPAAADLFPLTGHRSFRTLLERAPLALLLGAAAHRFETWNTEVTTLPAQHPLSTELCLLLLGPSCSTVLAAAPSGGEQPDRWRVVVSQDPGVCRRVMHRLLRVIDDDVEHLRGSD